MRHPAGELAHCFHFLRLTQSLLDLLALHRLQPQTFIGGLERRRTLRDGGLQRQIEPNLPLLAVAQCSLGSRSDRNLGLRRLV